MNNNCKMSSKFKLESQLNRQNISPYNTSSQNSKWLKTIYLSNLPKNLTEPDLEELMRIHVGEVIKCNIFKKDGISICEASLEFQKNKDALMAVTKMHLYELAGLKMKISLDSTGQLTRNALASMKMCENGEKSRKLKPLIDDTCNKSDELTMYHEIKKSVKLEPLIHDDDCNKSDELTMCEENKKSVRLNSLMDVNASKSEKLQSSKVFVHNISYKLNEQDLKKEFSKAGNVVRVDLFRDRNGNSRGIAEVEYEYESEALHAIKLLNTKLLMDRKIGVRLNFKPDFEKESNKSTRRQSNDIKLKPPKKEKSDNILKATHKTNEIMSKQANDSKNACPRIRESNSFDAERTRSLNPSSLSVIPKLMNQSPTVFFQQNAGNFAKPYFIINVL
jgi:RNA recognition motif-containing protein